MAGEVNLEQCVLDFLGGGVVLVVGTANATLEPEIGRAWGPLYRPETSVIEALLPLPDARNTLANLTPSCAVALTFTKPTDYSAFQLKGTCVEVREPGAEEWGRARAHFDAFLAEAACVGLDPAVYTAWFPGEGRLVAVAVECGFSQGPGPKAGLAL